MRGPSIRSDGASEAKHRREDLTALACARPPTESPWNTRSPAQSRFDTFVAGVDKSSQRRARPPLTRPSRATTPAHESLARGYRHNMVPDTMNTGRQAGRTQCRSADQGADSPGAGWGVLLLTRRRTVIQTDAPSANTLCISKPMRRACATGGTGRRGVPAASAPVRRAALCAPRLSPGVHRIGHHTMCGRPLVAGCRSYRARPRGYSPGADRIGHHCGRARDS